MQSMNTLDLAHDALIYEGYSRFEMSKENRERIRGILHSSDYIDRHGEERMVAILMTLEEADSTDPARRSNDASIIPGTGTWDGRWTDEQLALLRLFEYEKMLMASQVC